MLAPERRVSLDVLPATWDPYPFCLTTFCNMGRISYISQIIFQNLFMRDKSHFSPLAILVPPRSNSHRVTKVKKSCHHQKVGVSHFPLSTEIAPPPWVPISPVEETLWCGAGPCSSESLGLICEGILPHKAPLVLSTMLSLKLSNTRRCRILCSTFHHRPLIIPWPQIPRRWWGRSRK